MGPVQSVCWWLAIYFHFEGEDDGFVLTVEVVKEHYCYYYLSVLSILLH